jgi:hypothetical protein
MAQTVEESLSPAESVREQLAADSFPLVKWVLSFRRRRGATAVKQPRRGEQ